MRTAVIIPAFDEADALPMVLADLRAHVPDHEVVVVDDGSTDGTHRAAAEAGATCLRLPFNLGIGGALRLGFRYAAEQGFDRAYQFDADGQHDASQVPALLAGLDCADMVVGRRQSGHSGLYRAIGRKLIRLIAGLLVSMPISDLNSGMKLYRTQLAKRYLVLCPEGMAFSDIITLVFIHRRDLVLETQIEVRPRSEGVSTINTTTALETVFQILNIVALF